MNSVRCQVSRIFTPVAHIRTDLLDCLLDLIRQWPRIADARHASVSDDVETQCGQARDNARVLQVVCYDATAG